MTPGQSRKPITARKHMRMDVLAVLVGVAGGLGAVVFRWFIRFFHYIFYNITYGNIGSHATAGLDLGLVLLPALGSLIVGTIIYC
ncbi:MAG: hypothetical protein GSR87_00190 [Desulfurococcales archaeon]|nr:hypothetical protein [Desulfurococcales archaeon]